VPTDAPPRTGSFDVYLGAPDESGRQLLRWVDSRTGEKVTEIAIRTDDGLATRAGQYVYFYAPGTREPQRANTAGVVQPVSFAAPTPGVTYYEFLPSATGDFIAWLSVGVDRVFTIRLASADGSNARQVGGDTLLAGETVHLIRVANDGRRVFFDRRPSQITYQTIFNPRYDLYVLDGITGQVARLPGEPACGEARLCDAHISSDGSVLVRTLPPSAAYQQPVVVTNLISGYPLARFAPEGIPAGAAFEIGYPFLTPGGELIFVESYGPPQLERFVLVWGNIVTGEQRVVAELGYDRHRPLGWAADGVTLLTTREPDYYDTWQINIESGAMRQIAAMMFLGHIEQPPSVP